MDFVHEDDQKPNKGWEVREANNQSCKNQQQRTLPYLSFQTLNFIFLNSFPQVFQFVMAPFPPNVSPVCHVSVFIQAVPPAGSLSCDFTLLDKLKQIAPRTYSRVAKPSRFDFFFFLFFSQAKKCFLTTGAAGLSLFPVLWQL